MAAMELSLIAEQLGIPLWALVFATAWELTWTAYAMWIAARKNHLIWFVACFVISTLGILEVLYIFLFSKIKLKEVYPEKKIAKKRKKR